LKFFQAPKIRDSGKFVHSPKINTPKKTKETFKTIKFNMTGFKHRKKQRLSETLVHESIHKDKKPRRLNFRNTSLSSQNVADLLLAQRRTFDSRKSMDVSY